jgi:hypothetical protein
MIVLKGSIKCKIIVTVTNLGLRKDANSLPIAFLPPEKLNTC